MVQKTAAVKLHPNQGLIRVCIVDVCLELQRKKKKKTFKQVICQNGYRVVHYMSKLLLLRLIHKRTSRDKTFASAIRIALIVMASY